ncbi:MAG: peroxiredoxin [Rickettsiaceae bacterium]|nr:peroxiredoxin [Rickettsiaceae bacterium]
MTILTLKDKAPEFEAIGNNNKIIKLEDFKDKYLILYFYPKDNTPGCTIEAKDFEMLRSEFRKLNAVIVGVSKDNINSHNNFCKKYELNFDLIADENGVLCNKYGVLKEKSMFGRKYMGIERTTFLINPKGEIEYIWPSVKFFGHAQEVLDYLKLSVRA